MINQKKKRIISLIKDLTFFQQYKESSYQFTHEKALIETSLWIFQGFNLAKGYIFKAKGIASDSNWDALLSTTLRYAKLTAIYLNLKTISNEEQKSEVQGTEYFYDADFLQK